MEEELLASAQWSPVVTVTGPRQSGKTTLVRHLFPDKPYFNLENPDLLALATDDPRAFIDRMPDGGVLDEIQRAPHLLSYIQAIVDERSEKGLFILTGSQQLDLLGGVTQSLAGRSTILHLLPMTLHEMREADGSLSVDEALLTGGYPRILKEQLNPTRVYRDYVRTYLERDLRQLSAIRDLSLFQKFMRLCAGRIGQLLNVEGLAGDVGVSSHTIRHWISILEASFILIRLAPYYENFGKRMIKAPKLYFADTGLACYLLGIQELSQLRRDPLRGNLLENLCLLELVKSRENRGLDPDLFFFRDAHGHEVDFLLQRGGSLFPIEVKAGSTYNASFLKGLRYFQRVVGQQRCPKGALVYTGSEEQEIDDFSLVNIKRAASLGL